MERHIYLDKTLKIGTSGSIDAINFVMVDIGEIILPMKGEFTLSLQEHYFVGKFGFIWVTIFLYPASLEIFRFQYKHDLLVLSLKEI